MVKNKLVVGLLALISSHLFAAGTVTQTGRTQLGVPKHGQKVSFLVTGDAADGSVPDTEITLGGLVYKVVTNPGSTAPTDNYDVACGYSGDTALDVFGGALANRDTTNTEQVYPVITGATGPVYADRCTLQVTNNSVNSATVTIDFYVLTP